MEFDLIARIRNRVVPRGDVVLGIGDDAALLQPPPGMQLAVAMDTLNAGVHFPHGTAAADIGWKALAVNLSDLAAMGAQPAWCTLSLSMPQADAAWLDGFVEGFAALASRHEVALVGGDTTSGPLSVCVTVHGVVEPGTALRRDRARAGDDVWVSGTPGDAAGALALLQAADGLAPPDAGPTRDARPHVPDAPIASLRARLDRPTPRIGLGRALRGVAHACIDVSDGLLADLAHICAASAVGATIELTALPASAALASAFDADSRQRLQATGGDDYELCFTAPPAARRAVSSLAAQAGVQLTRIGRIDAGHGVRALDAGGRERAWPRAGFEHFSAA